MATVVTFQELLRDPTSLCSRLHRDIAVTCLLERYFAASPSKSAPRPVNEEFPVVTDKFGNRYTFYNGYLYITPTTGPFPLTVRLADWRAAPRLVPHFDGVLIVEGTSFARPDAHPIWRVNSQGVKSLLRGLPYYRDPISHRSSGPSQWLRVDGFLEIGPTNEALFAAPAFNGHPGQSLYYVRLRNNLLGLHNGMSTRGRLFYRFHMHGSSSRVTVQSISVDATQLRITYTSSRTGKQHQQAWDLADLVNRNKWDPYESDHPLSLTAG